MTDELERQVERGGLFTHTALSECAERLTEVETMLYGRCLRVPTEHSRELWNQPRYWSPPSRYRSEGHGKSGSLPCTAR